MKKVTYWKRLSHHPGISFAVAMTALGLMAGFARPDGNWAFGLVGLLVWIPLLITARTQPVPEDD
jgi:hypothetical protein